MDSKREAAQAASYSFSSLGDSAVILSFGQHIDEGTHRKVTALAALLEAQPFSGMIECVPAFASVAVHYHPVQVLNSRNNEERGHETINETVCKQINAVAAKLHSRPDDTQITHSSFEAHSSFETHMPIETQRTIEIPVCYGGDFGPDLGFVAAHCGLSEEEIIAIHSSGDYLVYMIGFAPGFPYLGGMPERIAAPRHRTPRTVIPRGSVGIAGGQTGVYPIATPGGWQLIGRTPLELFRPESEYPSLLRAGDKVRFKPITREQYRDGDWNGKDAKRLEAT